jgi:ribonuclease HI
MANSSLTIFSDGGSRGNPGPAACAYVIYRDDVIIAKDAKYLGITTNNVAEYEGVLLALQYLVTSNLDTSVFFYLDSQLVVRQLEGRYKIKDEKLVKLAEQVQSLQRMHNLEIKWEHVLRNKNKIADALVNEKLDTSSRL